MDKYLHTENAFIPNISKLFSIKRVVDFLLLQLNYFLFVIIIFIIIFNWFSILTVFIVWILQIRTHLKQWILLVENLLRDYVLQLNIIPKNIIGKMKFNWFVFNIPIRNILADPIIEIICKFIIIWVFGLMNFNEWNIRYR